MSGREHHRRFQFEGLVFGDWTVLGYHDSRAGTGSRWLCRCECGTERPVDGRSLKRGQSLGCGCRRGERIRAIKTKHGHSMPGTQTDTYVSWRGMLDRVRGKRGKDQKYYTGIKVCPEWDPRQGGGYLNFLRDLGWRPPGKTLDRVDARLGYFKENCRWATLSQQSLNQRRYYLDNQPREC